MLCFFAHYDDFFLCSVWSYDDFFLCRDYRYTAFLLNILLGEGSKNVGELGDLDLTCAGDSLPMGEAAASG